MSKMTKQEIKTKLKKYCADQEKNNGWWIFKKNILNFHITHLQEQYNRTANLALPDNIVIGRDVTLSNSGLFYKLILNKWNTVVETVIKTQAIPTNYDLYEKHYFLIFALNNGDIFEVEINNFDYYHGQLEHFIEQYKLSKLADK